MELASNVLILSNPREGFNVVLEASGEGHIFWGEEDIPLIANLLALIYPFIREKVNDCFNANNTLFLLYPINTFKLIKDLRFLCNKRYQRITALQVDNFHGVLPRESVGSNC